MIPGVNPRQMQQMMKRMGINQQEVSDAQQVIIRCNAREIVIDNPQVSKVNMMGQETWQIVGHAEERSLSSTPEIQEEDIEAVVAQAGCTPDEARAALEEHKGDLAAAILALMEKK